MPRYRTDIAVNTKVKQGYSFDPVIEADRAAEAAIRAEIARRFSDHAILGKELGLTGSGSALHAETLRILGSPPLRRPWTHALAIIARMSACNLDRSPRDRGGPFREGPHHSTSLTTP
jgi:hypothetical protein